MYQAVMYNKLSNLCAETKTCVAIFSSSGKILYSSLFKADEAHSLYSEYISAGTLSSPHCFARDFHLQNGKSVAIIKTDGVCDKKFSDVLFAYMEDIIARAESKLSFSEQLSAGKPSQALISDIEHDISNNGAYSLRFIQISAPLERIPDIVNIIDDISADEILKYSISQDSIYIIKYLFDESNAEECMEFAMALMDTIHTEIGANAKIAVSSKCLSPDPSTLICAFNDLKRTMSAGMVCKDSEDIYQSELFLVEKFLLSVPRDELTKFCSALEAYGLKEIMDKKTKQTIKCLFDNDLNIAETSRHLYTHRNTLVYRLEKIKSVSGLDLKHFSNAMVFDLYMTATKILEGQN